jgi:hypothetical protein
LKIVAAFEEAQAKGLGVVSLGTRMVDPPVVLRAQRLVERARRTGQIPDGDAEGGSAAAGTAGDAAAGMGGGAGTSGGEI